MFTFVKYVCFLATFSSLLFLPRNASPYFMARGIVDGFDRQYGTYGSTSFSTVTNKGDVRNFFDEVLVEALFPEEDGTDESSESSLDGDGNAQGQVLQGANRKIGAVRIRVQKVVKDSCVVPKVLQGSGGSSDTASDSSSSVVPSVSPSVECYGSLTSSTLDKSPTLDYVFSPPPPPADDGTVVAPTPAPLTLTFDPSALGWTSPLSKLSYPSGAHTLLLPSSVSSASEVIASLLASDLLSSSSSVRSLVVDVNLYNPSVDLVAIVQLRLEYTSSGCVISSTNVVALPLLKAVRVLKEDGASNFDKSMVILEIGFFAFVAVYIVEEFRLAHCSKDGKVAYFTGDVWNFMELVNLSLFVVVIVCRCVSVSLIASSYGKFSTSYSSFVSFDYIMMFAKNVDNVNAFNAVFTYLKLFKYLRNNRRMSQLIDTLSVACGDMLSILFIILTIGTAYGIAFHLAFGDSILEYRDFNESLFTLFLAVLGDFDLSKVRRKNPTLGAFLFVSFVVVMFFVVLSMFLAIVDRAYEVVSDRIKEHDDARRRRRATAAGTTAGQQDEGEGEGDDPLSRDLVRIFDAPFEGFRTAAKAIAGRVKGAKIATAAGEQGNKEGGGAAGSAAASGKTSLQLQKEEEEAEAERKKKEKELTPVEVAEHQFKKLYDDAMKRVETLAKSQKEIQEVLEKVEKVLGQAEVDRMKDKERIEGGVEQKE